MIKRLQSEDISVSSQLVQLLGVSSVCIQPAEKFDIRETDSDYHFCARCRKNNRPKSESLCIRCTDALSKI